MAPKVLVTGGSGLVGMAIKEVITEDPAGANTGNGAEWLFARSSDADLTNLDACMALFKKFQPTHVIHLAANVGGLFKNMKYRVEMYRDNMMINDNVLHCAHAVGCKKVVSCLSTCIFPDKTSFPIDETMVHNGAPHHSNEGYAYAKRMIDVANRCYHEQHGDIFTSVIPTNIYGRHDNFHLEDSHVIPGLMHKLYLAKQKGEAFVVRGTGKPLRQFIFSKDLAALMVWACWHYDSVEPLILSPDESDEVSIGDVGRMIASAMEFPGEIQFDPSFADGQFKKTASNSKLRGLRPDFKFVGMEEGIKQTVEWFVANYDSVRK